MKKHFGDVDPATLVMIGDRYSTDVLFGNLHGEISCCRTRPLWVAAFLTFFSTCWTLNRLFDDSDRAIYTGE